MAGELVVRRGAGRRRVGALAAALVALAGVVGIVGVVPRARGTETFTFTRLAGDDRFATAAAIATATFPTADTVLVARADQYADALAGSFLAGQFSAPVLLTFPNEVPDTTLEALGTLRTKTVVILGGPQAVSPAVEEQLADTESTHPSGGNLVVARIGGPDRFETARMIGTRNGSTWGTLGGERVAIVATGLNFADALGAGPVAYAARFPIFLATTGSLPRPTVEALQVLGVKRVLLLGGPAAIGSAVEEQIRGLNGGIAVTRLAGQDRTATAAAVADFAVGTLGFGATHVDLALGLDFADALTGGPHGGATRSVLLLTATREAAGPATTAWLAAHKATLRSGHVFGGPKAITQTAANEAAVAAGAATNQLIDITPRAFAAQPASGNGRTMGTRTCTALLPAGVGAADIALFAADDVAVDANLQVTFRDANGDGLADLTVDGTGGVIRSVNGVSTGNTPTNYVNEAAPDASGAVKFVIDSGAPDHVVAVVFADTDFDNGLDLAGTGGFAKPRETFGAGCQTQWGPPTPPPAPFLVTVTSVDKVFHSFVGTPAAGGPWTFPYNGPNDQYSTSSGQLTFAEFETRVSPGDTVRGTFSPDPQAPTFYNLTDSAPAPPSTFTSSAQDTTVTLSWGASSTPNVEAYRVYRCAGSGCGNRGEFALVKEVPATQLSYQDKGLTLGTLYQWTVRTVDEGDESESFTPFRQHTITNNPPLVTAATATHDEGRDGHVSAGDVHRFIFSEPMASTVAASGSEYQVADGDGTAQTVSCGAGGTTCSLNSASVVILGTTYEAGRVLTVRLGSAVAGLDYPLTLNAVSAAWKDTVGTPLNLAGSPDRTIERDTTAPTIVDARATTDAGLQGQVDAGDVHRFVFSEPMAATADDAGASYALKDGDAVSQTTVTVTCGTGGTTCSLNTATVTIAGLGTFEAGRVLTVTVGTVSPSGGTVAGLQYPATVTSMDPAKVTDAEGNPTATPPGGDTTLEKAT